MVGVAFGTFHAVATLFAFNFLGDNQPTTDNVESIFQALNATTPDHLVAKYIWQSINVPLKNTSSTSDLFLNHWFTEILHKSTATNLKNESDHSERTPNSVSKLFKEIAKFVHISVNQENKAKFYSDILNGIQSLNISSDDAAFTLGKFVLLDKVQNQYVPVDGNDFDFATTTNNTNTLADMFSPVVWSVLKGKSATLKNKISGNFLYVGEIPGKSNGNEKEVLLWKSSQFVNQAQALFNFNITGEQNDSQTRFRLLYKFSLGNKMTTNELFFREGKGNASIFPLSVTPMNASASSNKVWKVELIRNSNSVRIVIEENRLLGSKNYALCAPNETQFEIDELRRKAVMLEISDTFLPPECAWDVIEV